MWTNKLITLHRSHPSDLIFRKLCPGTKSLRRISKIPEQSQVLHGHVKRVPSFLNYDYSTLVSRPESPIPLGLLARANSRVNSLEKTVKDAKELLELDSFPSLPSLTLKSLFSNQVDVIEAHMRKLLGSQHPILKLARDFYQENAHLFQKADSKPEIFEGNSSPSSVNHSSLSNQLRAIIVLLVAKCIDVPLRAGQDADAVKAIHTKQRAIAEITEMMYTAYALHQTILDIPSPDVEMERVPDWLTDPVSVSRMHDGNNLAALMGDFLLAKTSGGLSSLKNAVVTELMTNTISDFAESQFLEVLCKGPPQIMGELWLRRNRLGTGSLMRNACHSCLIFSGHEEPIINLGKHLGEQLGLLLQASKEIGFYAIKTDEIPIQFDLNTLPVIYAAELKHVSVERLTELAGRHDYEQIYKEVVQCKPAMDKSIAKVVDLEGNIEKMLRQLNSSSPEAVSILIDLIGCVTGSVSGQGDESNRIITNGY